MFDPIDRAKEELKRTDHLFYVTLKYTRTGDVLRNIIERLINSHDAFFDTILEELRDRKKISKEITIPLLKCDELEKLYPEDKMIKKSIEQFRLFRKLLKVPYKAESEYRKPVKIIMQLEGKEYVIDIEKVDEYFTFAREMMDYTKSFVENMKD